MTSTYMRDIGFVDVQEKLMAWPIGSWPKDEKVKVLGAWFEEDVLSGLQGTSMAILTRGLGMTIEGVEILSMGGEARYRFERVALLYPDVSFLLHG